MKTHTISLCTLGVASPFLLGDFETTTEKYFEEENNDYFVGANVFQDIKNKIPKYRTYQTKKWMQAHKEALNNKPFCKIVLPGAHDAGAYAFDRNSKIVDLPKFIEEARKVIKWLPGDGYLTKWSKTQKLTIDEQLNAGIRYFDLRVSQNEDKNFYLYHGLQGPNLEPVLQTFRNFLNENKGEILVLDMSHFFKVSHNELLKLINKYLVEFCATQDDVNTSVTYGELISQNKRCLLYYDEKDLSPKHKFLLGKSDSYWANKRDIKELKNSLIDYHLNHSHNTPWVFQYVLTPNAKHIAKHPFGSVEDLAKITHDHLSEVLNDCKQNLQLNIFMFDFVEESLCRKIIKLNF